jgi:hypothetical protein
MVYHSENLLVLQVLVLGFSAAADRFSVDAWLRSVRPASGWQYGWPIRLLCAVTALTYFLAGVAKLAGPLGWSWASGDALRRQIAADALRKELLLGTAERPLLIPFDQVTCFTIIGLATLILELGALAALCHRRTSQIWALGVLAMHWGVLLVMGIRFEYQLSGVALACFFSLDQTGHGLKQLLVEIRSRARRAVAVLTAASGSFSSATRK